MRSQDDLNNSASVSVRADDPHHDVVAGLAAAKPPRKSRWPRPRVSVVIGLLCSLIVLCVAALTLYITISVSLTTVRALGSDHASALAANARVAVENDFTEPALQLDGFAALVRQQSFPLPGDDVNQAFKYTHDKYWHLLFAAASSAQYTYAASAFIFADGSSTALYPGGGGDSVYGFSRSAYEWPNGGDMIMYTYGVNTTTGLSVRAEDIAGPLANNVDARSAAYTTAESLIAGNPNGMWYPLTIYASYGTPRYVLPTLKPLYNGSGTLLGIAVLAKPISGVTTFLRSIPRTPNTELFAVDSRGYLVGSTHSAPYSTVTTVTESNPVVGPGCTSSADTRTNANDLVAVGCRQRASDFSAYAPLAAAASDSAFITASVATVKSIDVDGNQYFVVSTPVNNAYRFFGLNIVLCMPESDILGDIVQGRNTAIGVTVGVFVAAALLSFGLVYALLQPLSDVSRRMLDTARLKETEDDREYSSLAEIQDLQKAYTNMNTAIKSFTRYVPRDVVKDLMASGQLCEIKMAPLMCTMLFVDIAGFTTVCERVPPDALSALVSQYFDRASRIVMEHDGLIDKFIGDCIMAVWGAPFGVSNQEVKATLAGKLLDRETMVEPLSTAWDEAGELLRVRVGVSTGEVLAGNMGSADRMNYTVIGDPVNLAARLESLNKQFDTRVMVSEMTAEGLGGVFVLRLLMPIAVVGKDRPVKAYEVLGLARDLRPADIIIMDEQEFKIDGTASDGSESFGRSVSRVSDSQSQMSGSALSGSTRGRHVRRSKRAASKMVRDAAVRTATQQYPLAVSADDALFAQQHTKAVFLYTKGQFADAIAALDGLEKSPCMTRDKGGRGDFRPERSVTLVRELCEKYLREGAPVGFDGTFKALEK